MESLDGWYHIRMQDGTEGYVSADYARYVPYGYVNATSLNVHSTTGINAPIIGSISCGTCVELLAYDGSWYKVKASNGLSGYVSADYISRTAVPSASSGYVTADSLRVRSSAGISAPVIGKVSYGDKLELLDYADGWYKIKASNGLSGYVSADYVSLTDPTGETQSSCGYVDATILNVREAPGMDSDIIGKLVMGTAVKIVSSSDGWHYIEAEDGTVGYVSLLYISETPIEESVISAAANNITRSDSGKVLTDAQRSLGEAIVVTAEDYLGTPYVYATAGPDSFDCSGFTMYVMDKHGISLPHQSASQATCGYEVALDELAAGDLVFFNTTRNSGVGHVGIYIGDGKFIHASSGSTHAVTISSLDEDYYSAHYLGARRVI